MKLEAGKHRHQVSATLGNTSTKMSRAANASKALSGDKTALARGEQAALQTRTCYQRAHDQTAATTIQYQE